MLLVLMLVSLTNALAPVLRPTPFAGFGLSWAFWLSTGLGLTLAARAVREPQQRPLNLFDLGVASLALALCLSHGSRMAVLAMSLSAVWALWRGGGPAFRSAALILLALTPGLLWTNMSFSLAAPAIEWVDAHVLGLVTGRPADGNLVPFADGTGTLVIRSGCTSLTNVGLAVMLWIAITRSVRPNARRSDWLWCLGLVGAVIALNQLRLGLVAQSLKAFAYWHDGQGGEIINTLITVTAVVLAGLTVRDDLRR